MATAISPYPRTRTSLQSNDWCFKSPERRDPRNCSLSITFQGNDASGQFRVTQIALRMGDDWCFVGMHLCRVAPPPSRG